MAALLRGFLVEFGRARERASAALADTANDAFPVTSVASKHEPAGP